MKKQSSSEAMDQSSTPSLLSHRFGKVRKHVVRLMVVCAGLVWVLFFQAEGASQADLISRGGVKVIIMIAGGFQKIIIIIRKKIIIIRKRKNTE